MIAHTPKLNVFNMFCGYTQTELGILSLSQIQSFHFVYMSDLFVYAMCITEYKGKTAVPSLFISFNVSLFN